MDDLLPETRFLCVDQAILKLRDPPASVFGVLGLKFASVLVAFLKLKLKAEDCPEY